MGVIHIYQINIRLTALTWNFTILPCEINTLNCRFSNCDVTKTNWSFAEGFKRNQLFVDPRVMIHTRFEMLFLSAFSLRKCQDTHVITQTYFSIYYNGSILMGQPLKVGLVMVQSRYWHILEGIKVFRLSPLEWDISLF